MQKLFLPLYSRRDYYSLCCFIRASCTKSRLSWLMNDIIPLDNLQPRLAYPFSTRISTLVRDLNVLPPLILRKEASHVPCFWEQAIFHLFWSSLYSNIKKHITRVYGSTVLSQQRVLAVLPFVYILTYSPDSHLHLRVVGRSHSYFGCSKRPPQLKNRLIPSLYRFCKCFTLLLRSASHKPHLG